LTRIAKLGTVVLVPILKYTTKKEFLMSDIFQPNDTVGCLPPAVNWHLWPKCNYECSYCFATFTDIPHDSVLKKMEAIKIPKLLADEGVQKITFVGGEPTLYPFLGDLLKISKDVGLTTCIVSNGTGLGDTFLNHYGSSIDWVGLSIDASNDKIHADMGRGVRKDIKEGVSHHLTQAKKVWKQCQDMGIRMKLNTVVCKKNLDDDMSALVLELRPERWKIFEVLSVDGQNDLYIQNLPLGEGDFERWCSRHAWVADHGIQFVPESNDLMRGSYAMMDALGRFYSNTKGHHEYGPSVLEVGVAKAWKYTDFSEKLFHERGGLYDWEHPLIQIT